MRRIFQGVHYLPAIVFLGLTVFPLLKIALLMAPTSPLAWQTYLAASNLLSGPEAVLPDIDTRLAPLLFGAAAIVGFYVDRMSKYPRFRFIYVHSALIMVLISAMDSSYRSAGIGLLPAGDGWNWSGLTSIGPMHFVFLAGVGLACIASHRRILWRMRHPVRRVEPLAI